MPERSHTPMGHVHCTSGAPTCSEIPHSLAWSRKAPSIHDVPRRGTVRVLTNKDVKPSGRVLRLCPVFSLREEKLDGGCSWKWERQAICTIPQHYILLVLCFPTTPHDTFKCNIGNYKVVRGMINYTKPNMTPLILQLHSITLQMPTT